MDENGPMLEDWPTKTIDDDVYSMAMWKMTRVMAYHATHTLEPHLTISTFIVIIMVFIRIIGENFEIQFLSLFQIDSNEWCHQILKSMLLIFILKVFIGILGAP